MADQAGTRATTSRPPRAPRTPKATATPTQTSRAKTAPATARAKATRASPAKAKAKPAKAKATPARARATLAEVTPLKVANERPVVRYQTIHGHRRAYRMMGQGPPLLLLHGIGDSSASWVPLMPALAENYTVIAPDLLGHGNSDKPRADYSAAAYANGMRDLLEVLDIDRATIVGHSLGGGIAAQVAYQYPDRCERLVLVASGGVDRSVSPILRMCAAPFSEVLLTPLRLPLGRLGINFALDVLAKAGHDIGRDRDEVRRVFEALPEGSARGAFTRTLRSVVDWRGQVVTMLDRVYLLGDLPVLIIWGARDAVIPVGHASMAHEAIPGSQLEIFGDSGHFPHHTDPERFLDVLREFIATTEPAVYDRDESRVRLREGRPLGV